jgi:hypothetical protein
MFEMSENKRLGDFPSGIGGDASKLLKMQTLLRHSWRLNMYFEYKVSKSL